MKTLLFRSLAIFFILLVATSIMMDTMNTEFGSVDFFQKHSIFFLIAITFVPRLTLLFSSVAFGGLLWWAGFIFCPRILVASLATVSYFHTNPVLVTMSWIIALGGEALEKLGFSSRKRVVFRTFNTGMPPRQEPDFHRGPYIKKDDAIEAEFTKKS